MMNEGFPTRHRCMSCGHLSQPANTMEEFKAIVEHHHGICASWLAERDAVYAEIRAKMATELEATTCAPLVQLMEILSSRISELEEENRRLRAGRPAGADTQWFVDYRSRVLAKPPEAFDAVVADVLRPRGLHMDWWEVIRKDQRQNADAMREAARLHIIKALDEALKEKQQ